MSFGGENTRSTDAFSHSIVKDTVAYHYYIFGSKAFLLEVLFCKVGFVPCFLVRMCQYSVKIVVETQLFEPC